MRGEDRAADPVRAPILSESRAWRPLLVGLSVTVAQIIMAVLLLAPEGPFSYRYVTLNQHDSFWFMNIVDRGYQTIVPPINHKVMEISNVAFFPAYPALTSVLTSLFNLDTEYALLIAAQLAAWGFWSYFFLLCQRWKLSGRLQLLGTLAIAAHPAAFFLIVGYSESLFLMALLGFIFWSAKETRLGRAFAIFHGMIMSATRIVGIPCAMIPIVQSIFASGTEIFRNPLAWARRNRGVLMVSGLATFGALAFFVYCQARWGQWNMYMLTQEAGWAITPDYLAVLRPSNYHWTLPPLNDPRQASQLSMTLLALFFIVIAVCELVPALRRRTSWPQRIGLYFGAVVIYYISVSGVACVDMESMLRYGFCAHTLLVLAVLHSLRQYRLKSALVRAFGTALIVLASAAGLALQGWYVWNFTRGNWVA
jgi:hypothetical protein